MAGLVGMKLRDVSVDAQISVEVVRQVLGLLEVLVLMSYQQDGYISDDALSNWLKKNLELDQQAVNLVKADLRRKGLAYYYPARVGGSSWKLTDAGLDIATKAPQDVRKSVADNKGSAPVRRF